MQILNIIVGFLFIAIGLNAFAVTVTVTDLQLQPVANAKLVVGFAENDPFENNFVLTNDLGQADIPDSWDLTLPVQISAPSFLKSIYVNSLPLITNFGLNHEDSRELIEIRGDATNFGELERDGKIDFALVYPAFQYNQFSRFDLSSVLSPESDEVKAGPKKFNIPSNITLPRQKETYIIPIEFNKPSYRFRLKQKGEYKMVATRGQFPLKKVVDDLQKGKSFFEVMRHFSFLGAGERNISVDKSLSNQDIAVDSIHFDNKLSSRAPALPAETTMLSFAVVNREGYFFATDLKQLDSGESTDLQLPSKRDGQFVMSLLLSKAQARNFGRKSSFAIDPMSSALLLMDTLNSHNLQEELLALEPASIDTDGISIARHDEGAIEPRFLDLVPKPVVSENNVTTTTPKVVDGIEVVSTRIILSEIEPSEHKGLVDDTYRVLEVVQLGWSGQVSVPGMRTAMEPGKQYKLDIIYTGRLTNHKKQAEYHIDDVTHITRNSINL